MMHHRSTRDAAKGKWKGILEMLGVPPAALTGRHGPCPICNDGKDRFRFDNKEGSGSYFCSKCGAGNGIDFAIAYTGREFRDISSAIDGIIGNLKPEAVRPAMTDDARRDLLRDTYRATQPIQPGDLADRYLTTRGLGDTAYSKSLRFAPQLRTGDGGTAPCLIAMITDSEGKPVSMHRTFLRLDGKGKAEMDSPRKLMPGAIPDGACVRTCDYVAPGPLGIAEGLETAMSASALYEMPVFAALNTAILKKWTPPEGCREVAIFGDNDANFAGHAAAYALAYRLRDDVDQVTVHFPERQGDDFNDVWMRRCAGRGKSQ